MPFTPEDKAFIKELYDMYYGSDNNNEEKLFEQKINIRKRNRKKKKEAPKMRYEKNQI